MYALLVFFLVDKKEDVHNLFHRKSHLLTAPTTKVVGFQRSLVLNEPLSKSRDYTIRTL